MSKRIKYEIDGQKVPSLKTVLDNCKIGGIRNLLYRANQAGLQGMEYDDPTEDTTNAGFYASETIKSGLNNQDYYSDSYSDNCIEKADAAINDFIAWQANINIQLAIKNLTLVSEDLSFGDTFNTYLIDDAEPCLVDIVMQNQIYPENLIKLAARAHLLEINGIAFGGRGFIIRINSPQNIEDPAIFSLHEYDGFVFETQVLRKMLELYDMQETLKTLL